MAIDARVVRGTAVASHMPNRFDSYGSRCGGRICRSKMPEPETLHRDPSGTSAGTIPNDGDRSRDDVYQCLISVMALSIAETAFKPVTY